MLLDQLWPSLAALGVFCCLVVLARARPSLVAGAALALFGGEAVFGAAPGFEVLGIVVYGRDAVFLALLTAGVIRLGRRASRPERSGLAGAAWWALLALAAVSLLRGVHAHGANLAGNDFRPAFYLLAGLVGLAAQPKATTCVRDIVDVWIGVALLLVAVGFARLVGVTVGVPIDQQPFLNGRPLYAWPTLVIAHAALLSFFAVPLKSRWARLPGLPHLFVIGVLLFRHRTVWAALAIAIVAMLMMASRDRSPAGEGGNRQWAGVLVGGGVLALLLLAGKGESLEQDLTTATETATSQGSTFLWRVEGWKALLEDQGANPQDLVFGIPYGAGYHREVFDAEVEYSPHSWYVQTVNRVGVLGCGLMVLGLVRLFRRGRESGLLPSKLGALLVLSTAVYGIAYYPPEVAGMLLGLVVLSARSAPSTAGVGDGSSGVRAPRVPGRSTVPVSA